MAETKPGTTRGTRSRARKPSTETISTTTEITTDNDLDLSGNDRDLPVEPRTHQFPATDGTPDGRDREIAQRSADGDTPGRLVKTYRVGRLVPTDNDPIHQANAVGLVQEAMQRGLHARGDIYLVDVDEHDQALNDTGTRRSQWTDLTYEVAVIPASIDTHPQDTTAPTVIHQARAGGGRRDDPDTDDVGDTS
jgi:hypothetical protein